MEKRLLLAFVLSAVIFAVWTVLFPPPEPPPEAVGAPREESLEGDVDSRVGREAETVAEAAPEGEAEGVEDAVVVGGETEVAEKVEGGHEGRFQLANEVLSAELSNRGAVVTELVLAEYQADGGGPLNLVQALESPERTLPLQLVWGEEADTRLYAVEPVDGGYRFMWSDGAGSSVEKVVMLAPGEYGLSVEVRLTGDLRGAWLSVGTGMRDTSPAERANRFSGWGDVAIAMGGEVERLRREKVKEDTAFQGPGIGFAGFADTYFLSLWRPLGDLSGVVVRPLEVAEVSEEGEESTLRVLKMLVDPGQAEFSGELFTAPKEYDLLQELGGGVERTLDFGFFHPISVFFLKALRWIHARWATTAWRSSC